MLTLLCLLYLFTLLLCILLHATAYML